MRVQGMNLLWHGRPRPWLREETRARAPVPRFLMPRLLILLSIVVAPAHSTGQTTTRAVDSVDDIKVDPATEALIQSSLKFLASKQLANGSFESEAHQVALTSYVLMAF